MADTRYYYDYHYPMPLVRLILQLLGKGQDPDQNQLTDTANREWFSQPRVGTDTSTECVTVTFRLPLSVSEIRTEVLRMPCIAEVWYQDRSNNWRPVLDTQRIPLRVRVDRSDTKSWFRWSTRCYPIVAKKVQLRLTRINDPALTDTPYPVGLRGTLIRRNVYDRTQGGAFEDELDVMGNTVSKYIRDWDAAQAADDNYTTFWKSAPQPDPAAVVSLYLDVRAEDGTPQVIDKLYLDPVYAGQHLNLYYSSDDAVGVRTPSPITLPPPSTEGAVLNAAWKFGRGLTDTATGTAESVYSWPLNVGPQSLQDAWIGVEWRPGFGTASDPELAQNPVLFEAQASTGAAYKPTLYYDPELRKFVLQLSNGAVTRTWSTGSISEEWAAGDAIKVVAGWRYLDGDRTVYIKVLDNQRRQIAALSASVPELLPDLVSFDGIAQVSNFRGTITNLVVKLESHDLTSESFLANPGYYCEPDPVLPDDAGRYPSTTLDNAVYIAPFLSREHGSGGSDSSHFGDKEWTPIWRNYVAIKGMLHLPQPISMKFLKLEFTNLTEQPYPIYESGIEVKYKVFPVSVTQQSSLGPKLYTGTGGFLGLGTFISVNGVKSVNWLDPNSVLQAIGGVMGPQIPPVMINTGTPYLTDTLPNRGDITVEQSRRIEASSGYVYARDAIQPYVMATDQYNTVIKAEGLQAIQPYVDVPWSEIEDANPGTITKVRSTGTVPIRGTDWWVYPGQQLKVPASVMRKLTETSTITERKLTLESRTRFNTTSVHRYEWRTVTRDAAIAYFAGVREVQPYTSTYVGGEDVAVYSFPSYTAAHWAGIGGTVRQIASGPVTAALPSVYGVLTSQEMISQSDFSKVAVSFQDSGLARSNPMWVDIGQDTDSISDTQLSPYFGVIPTDIPKGNWSDALAAWSDIETDWGSSYGLVGINVDNDRRYQGKRVVHFTRAAGAGQAGISLDQWTNFVPGAQFRIGAVFYRTEATNNDLVLRLTRSDGAVILEETLADAPAGRWHEAVSQFVEIPETLPNASFDNNLVGWVPAGGTWEPVSTTGYTGTNSARLTTNGTRSTLTSNRMEVMLNSTISASAWVKWSGITAGSPISLEALFYDSDDDLVQTVALENAVTPPTATTAAWSPVSGSAVVPTGLGVTQVAFRLVVEAAAGSGGSVWADDFSADVPGAPGQQYTVDLTVVGGEEEELYVSDLYTETTPIRYFVRLGPPGGDPIEVTDLRYTRGEALVTSTEPVNQMQVQTVITTPRAWAFGAKITPHYLK